MSSNQKRRQTKRPYQPTEKEKMAYSQQCTMAAHAGRVPPEPPWNDSGPVEPEVITTLHPEHPDYGKEPDVAVRSDQGQGS